MAQKVYLFLDAAGTDEMIDVMTDLGDEAFTNLIVTDPDQLERDDQMASAKMIYDAYKEMQDTLDDINAQIVDLRSDMKFVGRLVDMMPYQYLKRHETVLGPIHGSILDPREDTIYFQRDSLDSKFWNIYIWMPVEKDWYWVDTTEPYIDLFWHKDETQELLHAIGFVDGPNWVVMPLDRIRKSVETAFSVFAS